MYSKQYNEESTPTIKFGCTLMVILAINLIVYFVQESIKDNNQTPVYYSCLVIQKRMTWLIEFIDRIIFIAALSNAVILSLLICHERFEKCIELLIKVVVSFIVTFSGIIFMFIQISIYKKEAWDCSQNFEAVENLRNVLLFWSTVGFIFFGCCCLCLCV